jgi:hypothetical protein
MAQTGFFSLRVEPGDATSGVVIIPDDTKLVVSQAAVVPDGKGSKPVQVSLETEDWTGANASAHVATLFPNQCGGTQALLSLVFSPGETVTFVARGGAAVDICGTMELCPDEDGQFYDDDDDGDDDDMDDEYREIMQDMDYARQYLDDDDDDDDDDDAFDDDESLEGAIRKRSIDIDADAEDGKRKRGGDSDSDSDSEAEAPPPPPPAKKKNKKKKTKK